MVHSEARLHDDGTGKAFVLPDVSVIGRSRESAVPIPDPVKERAKPKVPLPTELPSPLDTRSALTFLRSKRIDDPDAVQYVPKFLEVAPGHFVAEHD